MTFENITMDEMEEYYAKDKPMQKLFEKLATVREAIKNAEAKKLRYEQIKVLADERKEIMQAIRARRMEYYNELKKVQVVVIGENRSGIIAEHPLGLQFSLTDKPVMLPVNQAKTLQKEGVAKLWVTQ